MKRRIIFLCLLLAQGLSFAQEPVSALQDTVSKSRIDSLHAEEVKNLQDRIAKYKLMQDRLDELEIQRENDSIHSAILQAEVTRLSGITNVSDNDTTELNSVEIKRNLIKSRMKVAIDLSDDLYYDSLGAPVLSEFGDTLFLLHAHGGGMTASERAVLVSRKIKQLGDDDFFESGKMELFEKNGSYDLRYDDLILMNVSAGDAKVYGLSAKRLAVDYEWIIIDAVTVARQEGTLLKWVFRIGLAIVVLLISMLIIKLVGKGYDKLLLRVEERKESWFKDLSYRNYTFMTADQELKGTFFVLRLLSWGLYIMFFYLTLPALFSIFPFSRGWADVLFRLIWSPFRSIFVAVWNYVPNLFSIFVIYFIMRYVVKFVKYIFLEIETGKLKVSGFHIDWAYPTYQIVSFLLYAFMFVMIFPYLPGSDSGIFKGVSMFLGLLLSLGSSSAISNMVSGLVITYMRPFMIGDRIKINDVSGDVIEKTLLVTRIKTVKNEIITIPNSSILTGNTTNFTFEARNKGLIIYTSVTIGYDVPWKEMHAALLEAASRTELLQKEPVPFVLQTSLEDFYVAYQLNAYTKEAGKQAIIYSNLHANIQDVCNERGIEILSPHYRAARDGSTTTIPANYLPADYVAPSFKVELNDGKMK
ncbi:MAG: mechanosensitive ion channel domain-containing protein [Mangrovibacterium sp.]